jgi:Modifier of rudimentary (Mod(r)) protein
MSIAANFEPWPWLWRCNKFLTLWCRPSLACCVHPRYRLIESKVSSIKTQIEELEKKHRAKQEELKRLSTNDTGKSVEDLLEIETQKYAESTEIYDDWLSRNSRVALNQRLEEESHRLKYDSDTMQKQFLAGEIPHERFVVDYRELRRRYHELMIKLEFEKSRVSGASARSSST